MAKQAVTALKQIQQEGEQRKRTSKCFSRYVFAVCDRAPMADHISKKQKTISPYRIRCGDSMRTRTLRDVLAEVA
mgnify:CR=1 FL=1